jgi:Flp pilus assembly pilin Flp
VLRDDLRGSQLKAEPTRDAPQDDVAHQGRQPRLTRLWLLLRDRRALVAVEYAVIAGVMVFVVFTVTGPFATALGNMFVHVTAEL